MGIYMLATGDEVFITGQSRINGEVIDHIDDRSCVTRKIPYKEYTFSDKDDRLIAIVDNPDENTSSVIRKIQETVKQLPEKIRTYKSPSCSMYPIYVFLSKTKKILKVIQGWEKPIYTYYRQAGDEQ